MVAFTDHEATCTAVNMCCRLTYYMTGMIEVFMHENPISKQWECEQDVAVLWQRCVFPAFTSSLYHERISYCIHRPFCVVLFYFWNLSRMRFQPGSNAAHDIIILSVFLCCYMLVYQSRRGKKKKKTFSHFVLYMMPVALACPTKQQHIIKNWISSPVFKIFMWAACAELKWTWSEEVEPLYAGLLGYDTSVERHDPVFRWLSCSMSCYFNRTQHLWENETYIYFLLGLCKRYRDKLLSHL